VGNIRQVFFEDEGFVIPAGGCAIATAKDGHTHIMLTEEASYALNARRLPGAAQGQIADADDRNPGLGDAFPAAVKTPVAIANNPAIGHAGHSQTGPLAHCPTTSGTAANQLLKIGSRERQWLSCVPRCSGSKPWAEVL